MNDLISICIPTYKRPQLLEESLYSCLAQSYQNLEIIVSDDSPDDQSEQVVERIRENCAFEIRYIRNEVALQQAANVNSLFDTARGDRLVLLHDDDILLPNAIADLARCWDLHPTLDAAYGKQYLIDNEGNALDGADEFNAGFLRTSKHAGSVLSTTESALMQQFPNDCYLIKSETARKVRYRDQSEVRTMRWCDFDFGIRLAKYGASFYFLDEYTAQYRLTKEAISRSGKPTYMFPLIKNMRVKKSERWAKTGALENLAPIVALNYAMKGQRLKAMRVYFSRYYGARKKITKGGLFCLILIIIPFNLKFANWVQKLLKR